MTTSRIVIRPRQIYRVSLNKEKPIRMYLPTGDYKSLEESADCLMTGHVMDACGLLKELERGHILVEEFTLVPPDRDEAPDHFERYQATMRHLMRGKVLFLSDVGIYTDPASDRDKSADRFTAKKQKEVVLATSDVTKEEEEPVEAPDDAPDVIEEDQADRLESAMEREPLKVLKGGAESDTDEEELLIDEEPEPEPEPEPEAESESKEEKSSSSKKKSSKKKKGKRAKKKGKE